MPKGIYERTKEARQHMSEAQKGRTLSEEHKRNLRKPKSEETKRKISISKRNPSKETRKKISEAQKGRVHMPHSEETKEKIGRKNSNPNQIVVHHIDGNHNNNDTSNLMTMTRSAHIQLHLRQGSYTGRPRK